MTTVLLSPDLFSKDVAELAGDAHHHLFRVKRLQEGDALRAVDGLGHARAAKIESVSKHRARLALGEAAPANEPAGAVELFVAVPKPENAAWLVEKATELGVRSISFVATDREARSLAPAQLGRLRRIAISALEQCGRSWLPPVEDGGPVAHAVERARASGARVIALDGGGAPVKPEIVPGRAIALFAGPEGGWSSAENVLFRERADLDWKLGPTTLRVETAAVVAAAILLVPAS
jgi:16S rRNA (uracil1498-N3)-methyltransferase